MNCAFHICCRCNRSKCKWLQNKNLAQVEKVVGTLLQNFGFQNKDGIFLLPEETLFLLETVGTALSQKFSPQIGIARFMFSE